MRTIVHLSDLHFGRINDAAVQPLANAIKEIHPDLIVVSGDLTQRARESEFIAAQNFLTSLGVPSLVVPGNHDIPMYRVWERLFAPYRLYKKYINTNLEPTYEDEECAIAGINTARRSKFQNGRISLLQLAKLTAFFKKQPKEVFKMVIAHHPFDLPADANKPIVSHAHRAVRALLKCGVDIFLAGHTHHHYVGDTSRRYAAEGHTAVILQSGTAVSRRLRTEVNSFNVIMTKGNKMDIFHYAYDEKDIAFKGQEQAYHEDPAKSWSSSSL